ncbi:MAG: putative LPS assembly protein LptD [Saprospiraceae bacterium]|nr:putative LPS assembly protein LptD [Saprospiraceae bacterium]MDW8485246.1 putative LPS assembly protein LptD [Saprospiraceae bacterium]
MGKYRLFLQITWCILSVPVCAQVADTLSPFQRDTLAVRVDTLPPVPLSPDAIDREVEYGAQDSQWLDIRKRQMHLYGGAFVKYGTLELRAGYILVDFNTMELTATEIADSTGKLTGRPKFKDRDDEFEAIRLRYNFRTKRGLAYEARAKQQDLNIIGERTKFFGEAVRTKANEQPQNLIYNRGARISTCDHAEPHFAIRTKKLKIITDKLIVAGFSNLEIGGVPTPLILPFGFYPITKTRKSGLIIPRDFQPSRREGLGIMNWGYYLPLSEHMDVTLLFNVFTSGSWGVQSDVRYNFRYRYNGNFSLSYNNRIVENDRAQKNSFKSFGLRWSHQQDAKAHPTRTFGGSVNIETNRNQNRNRNDFGSVFQNTLNSNLNYSQRFPGKPYQFNAAFSHTQNTQTRIMNITFPSATFNLQRIFPFKRRNPVGNERWYEKISLTYASRLQNTISVADTLLFTYETLRNMRMGIQHQLSSDVNFKVFKYINVAPRFNYEENWYPYIVQRVFDPTIRYAYDTIAELIVVDSNRTVWGRDTTFRKWGFYPFRQYDLGISINTAMFFTKQFTKGWFRGIRHTLKPSISTGLRPDFSESRYFQQVQVSSRPGREAFRNYSIFDDAVFGRPSNAKPELAINYSLGNILEMKFYSAKRDTIRRVRLFDNLVFSGSYSISRDSLRWSTITTGGLFRLFKGLSNLTWRATFDPYLLDERGNRINRFAIREGKLLRMAAFGVELNTQTSIGDLRRLFEGKTPQGPQQPTATSQEKGDGFFDWFNQIQISHRISYERRQIFGTNRDTFLIGTNNISFFGTIPLTPKWTIDIGNISYDFQTKSLVYPDIGLTRDLHCWQFSLRWQPVRGTYEFFIAAKPGSLDFLRIPYRNNVFDAQSRF